jgi:hypothetical protein
LGSQFFNMCTQSIGNKGRDKIFDIILRVSIKSNLVSSNARTKVEKLENLHEA